jgi:hypothetical protein
MDDRAKNEPMMNYVENYEFLVRGLDFIIGKGDVKRIIRTAKAARNAAIEIVSILEKYSWPGKFLWLERIEELDVIVNHVEVK